MAKPKSSKTPGVAAIPECVIVGNGSAGPPPDCSETETALRGSAIGGSEAAKTDRVAAPSDEAHSRPNDDEFWSLGTVVLKTGLSRASIYRYAARDLFPARRRIGPGRVAWLASEVLAWMESRPRTRVRGESCATRHHLMGSEE